MRSGGRSHSRRGCRGGNQSAHRAREIGAFAQHGQPGCDDGRARTAGRRQHTHEFHEISWISSDCPELTNVYESTFHLSCQSSWHLDLLAKGELLLCSSSTLQQQAYSLITRQAVLQLPSPLVQLCRALRPVPATAEQ